MTWLKNFATPSEAQPPPLIGFGTTIEEKK